MKGVDLFMKYGSITCKTDDIKPLNNNTTHYYYSYDVLKIIAIICVLYNHQYPCYNCIETYNGMSFFYAVKLILSITCKIGPPLFFAVSGALLLGKTESFFYIFKHRILRMLILMVLCTVLLMCKINDFSNPFSVFFTQLNWYLYAYIGYLVMLPFLRLIAQGATLQQAKLFIILAFLFYSITGISMFFCFTQNFLQNIQLFTADWASTAWHLIFPLSGYFLVKIKNSETKKGYLYTILIFATIIELFLASLFIIHTVKFKTGISIEMMRQYFIFAPALLVFSLSFIIDNQKIGNRRMLARVLSEFGAATLFVFIIDTHTGLTFRICSIIDFKSYLGVYANCILNVFCALIIYSMAGIMVRKIPVIKRLF